MLRVVEGHFISGYADGGDAPDKELKLVPGALDDARVFLENETETQDRFTRVAELVEGFESSFGLELLSTVHWIADKEKPRNFEDLVTKTHDWNIRKQEFSQRQIKIAVDVLSQKGWIETPPAPKP